MSELAAFSFVLVAGFLLGALFFGGLWWTVLKGLTSQHPVLWFFSSSLLRTGLAMAGFYFISRADWRKFVVCLLGFARQWSKIRMEYRRLFDNADQLGPRAARGQV